MIEVYHMGIFQMSPEVDQSGWHGKKLKGYKIILQYSAAQASTFQKMVISAVENIYKYAWYL